MTLLGAHNFDEASGDILDVTGNGHGFPLLTGMSRVTGHTNTGLISSNGTIDGPAVYGQTAQRTLMFWLNTSGAFTGWIYEWHANTGDTGLWGMLGGVPSGQLGFRARNAGGSTQFAGIARPTDNLWHHWCGTFDGSVVRCYVDGVLRATSAALSGGIATNASLIRWHTTVSGLQPVDDVRVYDEALDITAINTLMNTPVVAAGAGVTLGLAAETDAASALVSTKAVTLGQPTEADTAHRIAASKARTLNAATEAGQAHSIGATKQRALAAPAETDAAHAVTASKQVTLGVATESDSAHGLSATFARTVGVAAASESDLAQRVAVTKTVVLGVATETDAVFALLGAKQITFAATAETDTARELTTGTVPDFALDVASETDSAHPIASAKAAALATATESDSARPLVMFKTVILGFAAEADSAAAITVAAVHILGVATETDTANQMVFGGSHGPAVQSVLTATHSGPDLTTAQDLPDLTPSNAPSSHLEVSHGL